MGAGQSVDAGLKAADIRVKGLNVSFGGVQAVRDLSFNVPAGSFLTILGPSGCGKSTTLRCLAGLERGDSGEIWCGDRLLAGPGTFVPPEARGMGMVFQSYAIWPHLSVFENIAYGLRGRRTSETDIVGRVNRIADVVGIRSLLERYPSQLSGGQQQRVALARSLVYEPPVLLLDEPLSNLDAKLRNQMRFELAAIQEHLRPTTVYVTHNQEEALVMSDYILMMQDGRAVQFGSPSELYSRPANRYAADFLGEANFFEGMAVSADGDRATDIAVAGGLVLRSVDAAGPRGPVVAMVRPPRVHLGRTRQEGANSFAGRVSYVAYLGETYEVWVKAGDITVRSNAGTSFAAGEDVWVTIRPEDVVIVERGNDQEA